jgi:hypothetical protein
MKTLFLLVRIDYGALFMQGELPAAAGLRIPPISAKY